MDDSSPSGCEHRRTGAASAVVVDIVSEADYNTAGVGVLPVDYSPLVSRAAESLLTNFGDLRIMSPVSPIYLTGSYTNNLAMAMEHAVGHPEYRASQAVSVT